VRSFSRLEKGLVVIVICLALSFGSFAMFSNSPALVKQVNTNSGLSGSIQVVHVSVSYVFQLLQPDGSVKTVYGDPTSLVTDIGVEFLRNISIGLTIAPATYTYATNNTCYIALGNGTAINYNDTQLTAEIASGDSGFHRTALLTPTYLNGTGGSYSGNGYYANFTVTNKFTSTVLDNINATSLQWSGVAGSNQNMFAEATIGYLGGGQDAGCYGQVFNGANSDNATITWTIQFGH